MGRPRSKGNTVVAKEAIVVVVGAKPAEYEQVQVTNRRTGELVWINKDDPKVEAEDGVPYAFKEGQKVSKNHAAVKDSPHSFVPLEEAEDLELVEA